MTANAEAPGSTVLPDGIKLGPVRLRVTSLDKALSVWRDLLGLTLISQSEDLLEVGTGDGRVLAVLHASAASPLTVRRLGLYHAAIHIPSRRDFALAAARLRSSGYAHTASDHLATESIYLADHDGNGIELTYETPWRGRFEPTEGGFRAVAADGSIHSGLEKLDLDGLVRDVDVEDPFVPLPAGTRLGHIHLHVSDLDKAMDFYAGVIGFEPQVKATRFGMYDAGTRTTKHILAFNTWAGPSAVQADGDVAGIESFTIQVPSAAVLDQVRERIKAAGMASVVDEDITLSTVDPDGNMVTIMRSS